MSCSEDGSEIAGGVASCNFTTILTTTSEVDYIKVWVNSRFFSYSRSQDKGKLETRA